MMNGMIITFLALVTSTVGVITADKSPTPWMKFPVHDHHATILDHPYDFKPKHSPVQGLHITLFGDDSVMATWLTPVEYKPGALEARCTYTINGIDFVVSHGHSYTYTAGCFHMTLSSALINVTRVSQNVHVPVSYKCGDVNLGLSDSHTFQLEYQTFNDTRVKRDKPKQKEDIDGHKIELLPNKKSVMDVEDENVFLMEKDEKSDSENDLMKEMRHLFGPEPSLTAVVGDMSVPYGDSTIDVMKKLTTLKYMKLLVHSGDISYADRYHDVAHGAINNSYIWTDYMNKMADITSTIPYMTCPGNHESEFLFAAYKNWFPTPYKESNSTNQMWYSFDYMGIHFVSMSTEHDFSDGSPQNDWIKRDLAAANRNRARVPWIVMSGHRPFYCTSDVTYTSKRCTYEAVYYRSYIEDILHSQHVDVYMCGHNHDYERTYPVYKRKATSKDYINATATVYIVNGEAGNVEGNKKSFSLDIPWRAHYNPNKHNGLTVMQASRSSLKFAYIDSTSNKVVDTFTISKQ